MLILVMERFAVCVNVIICKELAIGVRYEEMSIVSTLRVFQSEDEEEIFVFRVASPAMELYERIELRLLEI